MPWKANGPGCPCCSVNVCITVNGCPKSGSPPYHRFSGITVNAINGGVTVASGTTLGSGTVTFYTRSGATLTLGSATATAYNPSTTAVGANKVIIVIGREGGPWDVVVESCN